MAFHKSNFGRFGGGLPCDLDGYVPEAEDGPWDFRIDHGSERTHEGGALTEYGVWWEEEGFPEWRFRAVEATKAAQAALLEWQGQR